MIPTTSSFKITTTGEALRGFFNLRITSIERDVVRYEKALVNARAELERTKTDTDRQYQLAHERALQTAGIGGRHGGGFVHANPFAEQASAIARVEHELASIRDQRSAVVWLRDQIDPNKPYELSTGDMISLGLAELNLGGAMGRGIGGALDQLGHVC